RRHTRSKRDWSSDVCSSDLTFGALLAGRHIWGWRGHKALRWTAVGFALLILSYSGTRSVLDVLLHRGSARGQVHFLGYYFSSGLYCYTCAQFWALPPSMCRFCSSPSTEPSHQGRTD